VYLIGRCRFSPSDATTNPSLLLKAATMPQYAALLDEAVAHAKASELTGQAQLDLAMYVSFIVSACTHYTMHLSPYTCIVHRHGCRCFSFNHTLRCAWAFRGAKVG
jgi:hypothetical protein